MPFLKYDTGKSNIILDASTKKFSNLKGKEKQVDIALEIDGTPFEKLDIQPWYYYKIEGNKIVSSTEDDIDKLFDGNWPFNSRNRLVFRNTEKDDEDDDD